MGFENFPYVNFHELNLDWIAKIAKDFLEQYTHIQELISNGEQSLQDLTASGLEDLQEKADALEALLQEWYNTHSEDIAQELADAVADFSARAEAIAAETIKSIPADYTTLSNSVTEMRAFISSFSPNIDYLSNELIAVDPPLNVAFSAPIQTGFFKVNEYNISSNATTYQTHFVSVAPGMHIHIRAREEGGGGNIYDAIRFYDRSGNIVSTIVATAGVYTINENYTVPAKAFLMTITERINSDVIFECQKSEITSIDCLNNKRENELFREGLIQPVNVQNGFYFAHQFAVTSAPSYTLTRYDVNPGETVRIKTEYAGGSSANNVNAVRFYAKDGQSFGEWLNPASGTNQLDGVYTVPAYANQMLVLSNNNYISGGYYRVHTANTIAVFIGDSYTEANSLGASQHLRFSTRLCENNGWQEKNYAVGGMGYQYGATPFNDQLTNAIEDAGYDHAKVSHVFIIGGRNDSSLSESSFSPSAYIQAVKTVINRAKNNFQNAEIIVIPYLWDFTILSGLAYVQYIYITQACYETNCAVIPNGYMWMIGLKSLFLSDNIHPTANGHYLFFNHIQNSLKTGFNYPYPAKTKLAKDNANLTSDSYLTITQENGKIRFQGNIIASASVAANENIFSLSVSNNQNNQTMFSNWGIRIPAYNINSGALYWIALANAFTDDGYTVTAKPIQIMPAGTYIIQNFELPFGLQAYASNI